MITYVRTYRKSISVIRDTVEGRDMKVVSIDQAPQLYAVCNALRAGGKGSITTFKDGSWRYKKRGFFWPYKKESWSSFGLRVKSEI